MAHYISVSVKHSNSSSNRKILFSFILLFTSCCLLPTVVYSEVLDRVVAYVNNNAITLSAFQKSAQGAREKLGNVSDSDIINSMINNLLLVEAAKNMRLEAPDDDKLVQEYIDIKIKPAIIIREEDMERFYNENRGQFKGQDYVDVRDEIEKYLVELDTNKQLKKLIEELRSKSDIKILLNP
ncbi:MAG: hypothetical protein ACLQF0_04310 [Dissulfurispiraceae bacterium]